MEDDFVVKALREAIRRDREIPPLERFAAMVARGAIDSEGRVLIRIPMVDEEYRNEGQEKPVEAVPVPNGKKKTAKPEAVKGSKSKAAPTKPRKPKTS